MIRLGRLGKGAKPIDIGVSGARRGPVRIGALEHVTAIVKPGTFGQIAAELFAATLAREHGMRIAEPILVFDPEAKELLAGSIDLDLPNICIAYPDLDPTVTADFEVLMQKIKAWPEHAMLCAFDEWIKNFDRNIKNLLWDGAGCTPIDHAMSLNQHNPHMKDANKLVTSLFSVIPDDVGKRRLCNQMKRSALAFDEACLTESTLQLSLIGYPLISEFAPIFDSFLKDRLPLLDRIIKARFPYGQLLLIQST